jgi:hypothetical protein
MQPKEFRTCFKSSVVRGPGPSYRDPLLTITDRTSVPTTPYPHLQQCTDRRPPHPNQFVVSCPIYVYAYAPIYIRSIAFAFASRMYIRTLPVLPDEVPEERRPPTQRQVEGGTTSCRIQPCTFPSVAHEYRSPNTHRTNACLQSHTVKPPLQRLLICYR